MENIKLPNYNVRFSILKRTLFVLALFLVSNQFVYSQCGDDFSCETIDMNFTPMHGSDQPHPNWTTSHGSPTWRSDSFWIWANGNVGEGVNYSGSRFETGRTYCVTFQVRTGIRDATTFPPAARMNFILTKTPIIGFQSNSGGGGIPAQPTLMQLIDDPQFSSIPLGQWSTFTYTFTAQDDFDNIWFYPQGAHQSLDIQVEFELKDLKICELSYFDMTGPDVLCVGANETFNLLGDRGTDIISVEWEQSENIDILYRNNTVAGIIGTNSGSGFVRAIVTFRNGFGAIITETIQKDFEVISAPQDFELAISGPDLLCLNEDGTFNLVLELPTGGNLNVDWETSSNITQTDSDNSRIDITASGTGSAYVIATVTAYNVCGEFTKTVRKDFDILDKPQPFDLSISGPDSLCINNNGTFNLALELPTGGNLNVDWETSPNVVLTNSNNNTADITTTGYGSAYVMATVTAYNFCGETTQTIRKDFDVTGKPQISNAAITGAGLLCYVVNDTFNLSFGQVGGTNTNVVWEASSGIIITNSSNTHVDIVTPNSTNSGRSVYVKATITTSNGCETTTQSVQKDFWIGRPNSPNPQISGPMHACINQLTSYSLSMDPPDAYTTIINPSWSVTTGITMVSSDPTQATVQPYLLGPVITGTLSVNVYYTNACGFFTATDQFPLYFMTNGPNCVPFKTNEIEDNNAIKVYPNPSKGIMNVDVSADFEKGEEHLIAIFDLVGNKVFEQKFQNQKVTFEITDVKDGVYIMKISNAKKSVTKHILIQGN